MYLNSLFLLEISHQIRICYVSIQCFLYFQQKLLKYIKWLEKEVENMELNNNKAQLFKQLANYNNIKCKFQLLIFTTVIITIQARDLVKHIEIL